jgi:orotidine-5'-phosphate decarboxylase
MQQISAKDKLILALDFPDFDSHVKNLVEHLSDEINFYKIGLEMMMSGSYFEAIDFLKTKKGKKVFADLKFYDIPETVGRAVRNLSAYGVDLITIHTASHDIMREAARNKKQGTEILGVTVLTSLDQKDLIEMGFDPKVSLQELVIKKASMALEAGLDGVVASALEAKILREKFGDDFLIVTPGIRLEKTNDDQKRTATVLEALSNGASYLVVGRPITRSENPLLVAQKINQEISNAQV